jgi:hypothetical protein
MLRAVAVARLRVVAQLSAALGRRDPGRIPVLTRSDEAVAGPTITPAWLEPLGHAREVIVGLFRPSTEAERLKVVALKAECGRLRELCAERLRLIEELTSALGKTAAPSEGAGPSAVPDSAR